MCRRVRQGAAQQVQRRHQEKETDTPAAPKSNHDTPCKVARNNAHASKIWRFCGSLSTS